MSLFALWRDDLGFGTPVYFTDLRPFHPLYFLPPLALFLLSAITTVFAIDRFVRTPTRARWAAVCLTIAIGITGCSKGSILGLLAVAAAAFAIAAVRGDRRSDQGAIAGGLVAIVIAALLSAGWWLPMFALSSFAKGTAPYNSVDLVEAKPLATRASYVTREPRWFFPERFAVQNDPQKAVTRLLQSRDFDRFAVVDHMPAPVAALDEFRMLRNVNPLPRGQVTSVAQRGGRTVVRVSTEGWTLLASNRAWWPGWRAYVGATRLRPIRVNVAFLGVFVPPGTADIEFRFRPPETDTGLRLGAVGLLFFAIVCFFPAYRRAALTLPGQGQWRSAGVRDTLRRADVFLERTLTKLDRKAFTAVAALSLVAYFALLVAHSDAIAAGADSSGYLNQARLWMRGQLIVPLTLIERLGLPHDFDHVFMPLGFVHSSRLGVMVPSYPPGLPMHFAAAGVLFGERSWPFVVPLTATAAVLFMFFFARAAGAARLPAFAAAAMLAACPVFIFNAIQPVSDVPATLWAVAAAWLAVRGRESSKFAVGSGVAFAIGVLIRPTNVLMLPALVILLWNRGAIIRFLAGGAPFAVFLLAFNRLVYGSPFASGYGDLSLLLSLDGFLTRLEYYDSWLVTLLPIVFPLGLIGLGTRRIDARIRAACAAWLGAFFIFYCAYNVYDAWWYTRFLMPAFPATLLLAALVATIVLASGRRGFATAAVILLFATVIALQVHVLRKLDVWFFNKGEAHYPNAIFHAAPFLRRDALVVSSGYSGAIYHYLGITPIRTEALDPATFATLRSHAAARGLPIHALVPDPEIPELRRRAPGAWVVVTRFRYINLLLLREGPPLATSQSGGFQWPQTQSGEIRAVRAPEQSHQRP